MHRGKRTSNEFKPELSTLDCRSVPSASVSIVGAKMVIEADNVGGLIQIRDDGRGNVSVSAPGNALPLAKAAGIKQIVVRGGSGNDTIDFRTTGNLVHALDLDFELGAGNDHAYVDLYRGVSGVPLNLDVEGGAGADSVDASFGTINNARVNMHAALGAGADSGTATLFSGVSGASRVNLDVAGGAGADRVDFNVMGKIDSRSILNAHAENIADPYDRVLVRYKGELDGQLNVEVNQVAARYGVQSRFALDAASTGKLKAIVTDGTAAYGSVLTVTDHTGEAKVSVLDRLENILTGPVGTKVTTFRPPV